jgi:hypothetical protein
MAKPDRVFLLFLVLLCAFVCQQSLGLGTGSFSHPGPGLFPFLAATATGILALGLLVQSIVLKGNRGVELEDKKPFRKGMIAMVIVSLFAYTFAVMWFGFFLSTFVFVFFLLRVIEPEWSRWRGIAFSTMIMGGNYLIFEVWLKVGLPRGFLDW